MPATRHAPPPTKFGPGSVQPKTPQPGLTLERQGRQPAPPTKFGPELLQPKAAIPAPRLGASLPPPTRFNPPPPGDRFGSAGCGCCAGSATVQQRSSAFAPSGRKANNKPWTESAHDAGVYGVASKLTRGQAHATTGSSQTTYLDCSINSFFFGKFTNKLDDHFKKNKGISGKEEDEVQAIKLKRWKEYPSWCVKPDSWNNGDHKVGAPHAEDLLIMALNAAYKNNPNVFKTRGMPLVGKKPLLSIRINNSPCNRCAGNLLRACAKFGLSLRVKASFLHEQNDTDDSGTQVLTEAGVPVRHWRTAQINNKTAGASAGKRRGSVTEAGWFTAARNNGAVADAAWEAKYKRNTLDNSAAISSYATDTLMLG